MTHEEFLKNKDILSDILQAHFIRVAAIEYDNDGMITILLKYGTTMFLHGRTRKNTIFVSHLSDRLKKFKKIEYAGVAISRYLLRDKACDQCVLAYDGRCNFKKE